MSAREPLVVNAVWDDEAKVWVATSDQVPGLVTEAENPDALIKKLRVLIPEMLDCNGYADGEDIPFRLVSARDDIAHRETA